MRKERQNIESKHYKEIRAIRKENVQLVGTIEEKLKLVGMIECNLKSEMAKHLESNYDNDHLLASLRGKHKLHNELVRDDLRDEYKLLNESLLASERRKHALRTESLRDEYKLLGELLLQKHKLRNESLRDKC